jgi:hypothetical protein
MRAGGARDLPQRALELRGSYGFGNTTAPTPPSSALTSLPYPEERMTRSPGRWRTASRASSTPDLPGRLTSVNNTSKRSSASSSSASSALAVARASCPSPSSSSLAEERIASSSSTTKMRSEAGFGGTWAACAASRCSRWRNMLRTFQARSSRRYGLLKRLTPGSSRPPWTMAFSV